MKRHAPRIAPTDLRDHATDERVARVWARIEHDLGAPEPAQPRRTGLTAMLLAAAISAFGGGLLVGRAMWSEPSAAPVSALPSQDAQAPSEVFATGTRGRTFPLPGGGEITLLPGTTIEVEREADGALSLRLVQGEASIDTAASARTEPLAILAGDARVSTAAGSVFNVRHNVDDIDINVTDGSVRLTSPVGSRDLGRGESVDRVPIRQRTTTLVVPPRTSAPVLRAAPPPPAVEEPPAEPPAVVVAVPDWRARYNAGDEPGALEMLRQQGGGIDGAIGAAKSAKELMDLSDLLRGRGGDQAAAIRALSRVVDAFPGDVKYAEIAAYTLGNLYARQGDQARASTYYERARSLSPDGNLAEDSFCKRIGSEVLAGHKDEAIRMAQEYVSKYPDGRCEAVQRIVSGKGEDEGEGEPAPGAEQPAEPAPEGKPAP